MKNTLKKTIPTNDFDANLHLVRSIIDELSANGNSHNEYAPVLAGGAPRDLLLGKQPRDYDIFIDIDNKLGPTVRAAVAMTQTLNEVGRGPEEVLDKYSEDAISDLSFAINSGPIQLIASFKYFGTPIELVASFDMGINEAWAVFTNEGCELHATEAFDRCVKHKTLGDNQSTPNRTGRFLKKYPDFISLDELRTHNKGQLVDHHRIPF